MVDKNVSLLSDPQKAKLKVLEDALRQVPLAYQAAYMGLLAYPEYAGPPACGPLQSWQSRVRIPGVAGKAEGMAALGATR